MMMNRMIHGGCDDDGSGGDDEDGNDQCSSYMVA
jgi:hypothetical protein